MTNLEGSWKVNSVQKNFRKLFGKNENDRLLHFSRVYLQQQELSENFPKNSRECSEDFSQAINSLITGWTAYTKNINPSVLRIELPAVSLYLRTLGFIFFHIGSPTSF